MTVEAVLNYPPESEFRTSEFKGGSKNSPIINPQRNSPYCFSCCYTPLIMSLAVHPVQRKFVPKSVQNFCFHLFNESEFFFSFPGFIIIEENKRDGTP